MGVAAIGILGAISISGLQSQAPGNRVISVLKFLHISDVSFQTQAIILGLFRSLYYLYKHALRKKFPTQLPLASHKLHCMF